MPLFLFIFHIFITYIHSFIQSHSYIIFIHRHLLRSLSISSSLVCSVGKHLPVVPSRGSNSGLPYSKPTRFQLCHAAPLLCHAAPYCATPHHTVPRRTILCHAAPFLFKRKQIFLCLIYLLPVMTSILFNNSSVL